jgi:transcriptional regulator with XRE-family HTH domain
MEELNTKKFGSVLRAARLKMNLHQSELATLVRISSKAISSYELGRAMPTMAVFFRLIKATKIQPNEFLAQ